MASIRKNEFWREELMEVGEGAVGFSLYPTGDALEGEESFKEVYRSFVTLPEQTHTCNVAVVGRYATIDPEVMDADDGKEADDGKTVSGQRFPDTDALISFAPDIPVGIVTADCVPILLYAPDIRAVAAIHAGWKGTLNGIVDNTLDILFEHGADPGALKAAFGASISLDSYEVDKSLADRFIAAGFAGHVSHPDVGKPHIDLQGVNVERMLRRGLRQDNIKTHPGCTMGSRNRDGNHIYPSHRRSKGAPVRMLTAIRLEA